MDHSVGNLGAVRAFYDFKWMQISITKHRCLVSLRVHLDGLDKRLVFANRGKNYECRLHRKPIYQAKETMKWCKGIGQHDVDSFGILTRFQEPISWLDFYNFVPRNH